jgi:D-xylose 1-dehydrogenase (NADP+, D-xylono-1,5-lactone-forming)
MVRQTRLRWGLLSTARINRALIAPIRSSNNSQLVAVASRSLEKATSFANTWGIARVHPNYEALLADPEIDVIYNSLPNGLHTEWSIKAMHMGKHVLCEKPLAISSLEMDSIKLAVAETGKVITEAFMYRHHPQTIKVKELVDDGAIGKLQLILGAYFYVQSRPSDPRLDPALGGGSLWDIGCYPLSYARFIAGAEPAEVYGHQVIGPTGIDLLFAGQLHFPEGIIAQFECSFMTPYKTFMEIIGNKGRIIVPLPFKPEKRAKIFLEKEGQTQAIHIHGPELYNGEVEDIEKAILLGKPTRISLDDSRGNIVAIEALYRSARDGKPQIIR